MQDLPLNLTTLNPHGVPGLPEMRKVMIEDLLTPCLVFPLYPKKTNFVPEKGAIPGPGIVAFFLKPLGVVEATPISCLYLVAKRKKKVHVDYKSFDVCSTSVL